MLKLKIKFCDFHTHFNPEDNYIINTLRKELDIEVTNNPELVIYSVFGYNHLKYNCTRLFVTGENILPDFNVCDYAISFHYLNFKDRYFRYPYYMTCPDTYPFLFQKKDGSKILESKTEFCNFIYSNSDADPKRDELFHLINNYKKVHSGGKHLNNINESVDNKKEFIEKYKLTIAFENSSSPGYTTEKLIEPMQMNSIPIYWGNNEVSKEFNTASFINYHDFNNNEDFLKHIIEIDNNDDLYIKMMNQPWINVSHPKEKDFIAFIKKAYKDGRKRPYGILQTIYENQIKHFVKLRDMYRIGELITRPSPTFYQKLKHSLFKIVRKINKQLNILKK